VPKCPRLVEYRQRVALEKRLAYRDWTYWGKPGARISATPGRILLIVGLAPGGMALIALDGCLPATARASFISGAV